MALEIIDCLSRLNKEKLKNDEHDKNYIELLFLVNF